MKKTMSKLLCFLNRIGNKKGKAEGAQKMIVNFEDFRRINILVDQEKNIVIFPISKTSYPIVLLDGSVEECGYVTAYYPIELTFPYHVEELAEKIKYGIEQWNCHACFDDAGGKKTFEEKYYGIRGFKNAMKGKLNISLGWDDVLGKYVTLYVPVKRGYAYLEIHETRLPDDADWMDFAHAVMQYINMDLTQIRSFKTHRGQLNI